MPDLYEPSAPRWTISDFMNMKFATGILVIIAAMWAFGDRLFGGVNQIDANTEAVKANTTKIDDLTDNVDRLVGISESIMMRLDAHLVAPEIHQTSGEKFRDRAAWYEPVGERIDEQLNRQSERIRQLELFQAQTETRMNVLGNMHRQQIEKEK